MGKQKPVPLSKLHQRPKYTKPTKLKISLTAALRYAVENDPDALIGVAEVVLEKALEGDMKAIEFLTERLDGKVVTPLEISGISNLTDEQLVAYRNALKGSKK